ncbi:type IV pilus twitching motility protein PilT [Streptomyces sp. 5.8]|uniref:type IV pilus twitching motility protein PilT n=1 Tax=Streptomyces sp. 5.8 TaxID=3406571 RepID=UPI003BB5DA73
MAGAGRQRPAAHHRIGAVPPCRRRPATGRRARTDRAGGRPPGDRGTGQGTHGTLPPGEAGRFRVQLGGEGQVARERLRAARRVGPGAADHPVRRAVVRATRAPPPVVIGWAGKPRGFVLVTGPTGSGKSTSLAALLDHVNTHRPVHILTIEDPIEYLHQHKRSAVNQREVGTDTDSFPSALRAALREDPDVLLLGEMRDPESISAALTIAETGHLVFATLHTNDTGQTLDRIVDVFPAEQQPQIRLQLAHTLVGILNQTLIPKVGGGRAPAFEVLVGTSAIRNLIREGKTRQLRNMIATGHRDGMQTLETSINALVAAGTITYEEAVLHTAYPEDIQRPYAAAGRT